MRLAGLLFLVVSCGLLTPWGQWVARPHLKPYLSIRFRPFQRLKREDTFAPSTKGRV